MHGVNVQAVLQLTFLMATGSNSSLVIASTIFSLVTVTMTVAADDCLSLHLSPTNEETRYQWLLLTLFRVFDIFSKLTLYSLFYNSDGGGVIGVAMLMVNTSIGVSVYMFLKFKLSYFLRLKLLFSTFSR